MLQNNINVGFGIKAAKNVTGKSQFLKIFKCWKDLQDRYCKQENGDFPYYHGERANSSVFLAATWHAGGIGVQEYLSSKNWGGKQKHGRPDLFIRLNGGGADLEIKNKYVSFDMRPDTIQNALDEAIEDSRRNPDGANFGCAFIMPYLHKNSRPKLASERKELVRDFLKRCADSCDADLLSWYFPRSAWGMQPTGWKDSYIFPGVVIALKETKARKTRKGNRS